MFRNALKTFYLQTPFIIVMTILIIRDDLLKDYSVLKAY
jgi:hypothetical protein